MAGFSDLIVWKEAASLAANVALGMESLRGPAARSLAQQMIDAANSIHSNIAEGYGRGVSRDCLRLLKYAKASADELESRLRAAVIGRQLSPEIAEPLIDQCRRTGYLIYRFSQSVERRL
jgi:four helix bundle protein